MCDFFRKPGKVGAMTRDAWIAILMRRRGMSEQAAAHEVEAMIADGRLVPSAD